MPEPDPTGVAIECSNCGEPMRSLGTHKFRTGGPARGTYFFREWQELGEDQLPLEVFVCMPCRRVEFGVPPGMSVQPR